MLVKEVYKYNGEKTLFSQLLHSQIGWSTPQVRLHVLVTLSCSRIGYQISQTKLFVVVKQVLQYDQTNTLLLQIPNLLVGWWARPYFDSTTCKLLLSCDVIFFCTIRAFSPLVLQFVHIPWWSSLCCWKKLLECGVTILRQQPKATKHEIRK